MFADQLKNKHQKNLFILAILVILITIIFLVSFIAFQVNFKIGLYILGGILFLMIAYYIIEINLRNKRVYKMRFKVKSLEYKIPYPASFKKQQRTLCIDGKKAYTINKNIIPARFVEFVEGRRAYLIKELETIHEINEYKVLFVHQHTYALIEDVNTKKWLVHLNCLEPVIS
ncbi:MAG: hypothetical protein JXC31_00650 [Acholeplasmataceae bacterium]|nr:hypothetical protein [Acholeplasmataceae bacterium]